MPNKYVIGADDVRRPVCEIEPEPLEIEAAPIADQTAPPGAAAPAADQKPPRKPIRSKN